jgi:hypothetical protein
MTLKFSHLTALARDLETERRRQRSRERDRYETERQRGSFPYRCPTGGTLCRNLLILLGGKKWVRVTDLSHRWDGSEIKSVPPVGRFGVVLIPFHAGD